MHSARHLRRAATPRPLLRAINTLGFLALLTLSQCVCQSSRGDAPPKADPDAPTTVVSPDRNDTATKPVAPRETVPTFPATLDVGDLDGDEKKVLHAVLSEQFDPCGKPVSFLESLENPKTCDTAKTLGQGVVTMVAKGLSKKQIVRGLLKELKRITSKAEFVLTDSPYYGDPASKNVIVEFTDFQCPYCKLASQPIKQLAEKYGAVLYVKHLPLHHHTFAKEAAMASLAADRQGKFWEVYALIFDNQERLSSEIIRELVVSAGVDMARYDKDMASPTLAAIVARDGAEADQFQLEGTPTFYLNGSMMELSEIEAKLSGAE